MLAYPTAWFYVNLGTLVMLVLAAGWLIQSFENIGVVEFRRQRNFRASFALLGMKKVIGFSVTVSLADVPDLLGARRRDNCQRLTGVVLSYGLHP